MDVHDDDRTSPDLGAEDGTNPGIGSGEAYIAITASAYRTLAAIEAMANACPRVGETGRQRHLEVIAMKWGELGMLAHDTRRVTLELIREENP
jgi:hypothetical protein